jgi:uncharacterized protein YcbK (DUF882 family)
MGGDLSEHFSRREFACPDKCGFDAVDPKLITVLEWVRGLFPSSKIMINSGCRCTHHNIEVGGTPNSFHLKGMAADFEVSGISPDLVQKKINAADYRGGLEYAKTWTHIDTGPFRRFKP